MFLSSVKTAAPSGSATSGSGAPAVKSGGAPLPLAQSGQSVAQTGFNLQSLIQGAGSLLSVYNQQRLANENLRRSRQGLEPLTYQDVPGMVPTVQVQAGVDQNLQRTLLIGGALALGAFLLLGNSGKRA